MILTAKERCLINRRLYFRPDRLLRRRPLLIPLRLQPRIRGLERVMRTGLLPLLRRLHHRLFIPIRRSSLALTPPRLLKIIQVIIELFEHLKTIVFTQITTNKLGSTI